MNAVLPIFYVLAITIFVCPKSVFLAASHEVRLASREAEGALLSRAAQARDFVLFKSLPDLVSQEPRPKIIVPPLARTELLELSKNILASSRARRDTMIEYWNVSKPLLAPAPASCEGSDERHEPLFASHLCPKKEALTSPESLTKPEATFGPDLALDMLARPLNPSRPTTL
jgi:hypothetical protein